MEQLPVRIRQTRADSGKIRPDAEAAELDRIVVEKILRDAVAQSPAARDVRADGDDVGLRLCRRRR